MGDHTVLAKFAEGLSIFLTSPTIWLGIGILHLWGPSALRTLHKNSDNRDASEWLILGITVAFLGSVFDNGYWGIVWSASFSGSDKFGGLMTYGPLVNVVVRQAAGIYAAHCHIMAYITITNNITIRCRYRLAASIAVVLGLFWVIALVLLR